MKTFLIVYSWPALANIGDILSRIGIRSHLHAWNGLSIFKGTEDKAAYANLIHDQMPGAHFVITEYSAVSSYGWMDPKIWEWIKSIPDVQTPQ
jgi:hypothetical protein